MEPELIGEVVGFRAGQEKYEPGTLCGVRKQENAQKIKIKACKTAQETK